MYGPLVSIIIPVYNGSNYLREAIESALAQTYRNIEIIVVNDGSNDDGETEKIALSFGDKIRYFSKTNGGVATALNLAIMEMNGEYFSWLSHDDYYYPTKIELQLQALEKVQDKKKIVHSNYALLDVNSGRITQILQENMFDKSLLTNSVFPVLQGLIHGCSLLIHKSHFERVGLFNEDLPTTQDYDLWFRMFRFETTIFVSEPLLISRVHEEQGSKTVKNHQLFQSELYIEFVNNLTSIEAIEMYGSEYNFFHRMGLFFKSINMPLAYEYAMSKLMVVEKPKDIDIQLANLSKVINSYSNSRAEQICIFCNGQYGIRLFQDLKSKLINVKFFSDNNPDKWGKSIDGVPCIAPEELIKEKDKTLVIVANRAPNEILNQLKSDYKFPYVITKQDIDTVLFSTPPLNTY